MFGQRSRQQDILLFDVHRGKQWTRVKLRGQVPPRTYGGSMMPVGNNQILVFGGTDGECQGVPVRVMSYSTRHGVRCGL